MAKEVRGLVVLGSTGALGQQVLEVVQRFRDRFRVVGLAAATNLDLLAQQVQVFRPEAVSFLRDVELPLPSLLQDTPYLPLEELARHPEADLVVVATVGPAGLLATLAALEAGKGVALASKEVLVMAGELVTRLARKRGVELIPLDRELCSAWQSRRGEEPHLSRLYLTVPGMALRAAMERLSPEVPVPPWRRLGRRTTIDMKTLMHAGMQVIEAHWLFGLPYEKIQVLSHPQGVVPALVELCDGSVKATFGPFDPRQCLLVALAYPERWEWWEERRLKLTEVGELSFEALEGDRYPCFNLALEAARRGDTYPAVLAAANDVAVSLFLSHQIGFPEIPRVVESVLHQHRPIARPALEEILAAEAWAREFAARQLPE